MPAIYANYARCQGRSPGEQLALDERAWNHDADANFITWNIAMRRVFLGVAPWAFHKKVFIDEEAYETWLTKQTAAKLRAACQ
jgi:hypothetical protein